MIAQRMPSPPCSVFVAAGAGPATLDPSYEEGCARPPMGRMAIRPTTSAIKIPASTMASSAAIAFPEPFIAPAKTIPVTAAGYNPQSA